MRKISKSYWSPDFDSSSSCLLSFFFNDTATTEIYTLSLHDALPISPHQRLRSRGGIQPALLALDLRRDRKSTRLNSSHLVISYAVFCLQKKIPRRPRRGLSGRGSEIVRVEHRQRAF